METTDWGSGYFAWYVLGYAVLVGAAWWGRGRVAGLARWLRITVRTVGALVLLAGAGLVVGEAYFLFGYDGTDAYLFLRSTERWIDRHVETNEIGFRDPDWEQRTERDSGIVRIAVLGDGFTFGQGIEDPADRFTNLLADRLNARDDSLTYQVLNIALPRWDTRAHVDMARELVPFLGLDDLILVYNIDDAQDLTYVPETLDLVVEQRPEWRRALGDRSLFLDYLLTRRLVVRGLGLSYGLLREAYETRRHSAFQITRLRQIQSITNRLEIPMRVVVLPLMGEGWEAYSFAEEHPRLRASFQRYDLPVLDLLDHLRQRPVREWWVGPLDMHPNEEAHAMTADVIYRTFYQN